MYAIASGAPGPVALAEQGPIFPVVVLGPGGSQIYTAQIDDGSSISSVDNAILQALGCPQVGTTTIETVTGTQQVPVYAAGLATLGGVSLSADLPGILGDSLPAGGPRILIGRDVLDRFEFVLNEPGGSWALDAPGTGPGSSTGGLNPWLIAIAAGTAGTLLGVGILALGGAARQEALARRARAA